MSFRILFSLSNIFLCLTIKFCTNICDRHNYSAIFVMLPLLDYEKLTGPQFLAINFLTWTTFIHHSIKRDIPFQRGNRLTKALDETAICFLAFTRIIIPWQLHTGITVAAFTAKFLFDSSFINHMVYIYASSYTWPVLMSPYFMILLISTGYSYRILKFQDNSYPWHLCNGLCLYTIHKYFPVTLEIAS